MTAYIGLFMSALIAATMLPMQSEIVLASLLALGDQPVWALIAVATTGNVLGAVINWLLGRYIERFRDRRWFPLRESQLDRFQRMYHRWGHWSLLMSWAPFVGDPLTVIAGVLREPLWSFVLIVLIAKLGRYLVVAGITLGVLG